MESDARVSGAWNADTCSGKTRLSSRCAPCACRIHNSASAAQPEARCRRVSKIIWPSDFEHAGFLLLPLCFLRVDRSREEGCCARFKFFLPLGRVRELFSLSSRARTHAHARPIDASTCPPPRARFHRLARINVRAQKPTADPSRYTTHRGLSSEGRKPGNYYVSRETRGNPDFFFFSLPSRILKGSSSSIREKLFTRCEFFFSRGRDIISLARIRVLLLREMCYRGNLNYYSRGSVFSSFLFRRVEGNYPRLKIFYGFHWGWWNKKWIGWVSENRGIDWKWD